MTIAIDFDDTLTADSELWRSFIENAKQLGHRVICITARRDTEDNRETVENWMTMHGIELLTWYTGLQSKVDYAKRVGLKVDSWIDDDLKRAALGH